MEGKDEREKNNEKYPTYPFFTHTHSSKLATDSNTFREEGREGKGEAKVYKR